MLMASLAKTLEIAWRIDLLRHLIPTSFLRHYDQLKTHGKLGVAPIIRGVCGGCHFTMPRSRVFELRHANEPLNLCDNCGAFIYLDEQEQDDAAKEDAIGANTQSAPTPNPEDCALVRTKQLQHHE
jgi:hypothetical protein